MEAAESTFWPSPHLQSIQVGRPRSYGSEDASDPMDKLWTTGFFKEQIGGAVFVTKTNLIGDGQADLRFHGGLDKAVLAYSADHYAAWQSELECDIPPGAFGENLTIAGVTERDVCIGDVWSLGDVLLQVSQPRQPCWKLARRWRIKDLTARVVENGRTGWYFRVIEEGLIEAGQDLQLTSRPRPTWTVARASYLMHHDKRNYEAAAELASLPELSRSWKKELNERAEGR
jgi:MOSC domain-containing protein YiiM